MPFPPQMLAFILAFLRFVLAGVNVGHPRITLGWLGAAALTIALAWTP